MDDDKNALQTVAEKPRKQAGKSVSLPVSVRDHAKGGAHQQLAEQDEHGPHGHHAKIQEQQQGREHERLIGDGVQEFTEVGVISLRERAR